MRVTCRKGVGRVGSRANNGDRYRKGMESKNEESVMVRWTSKGCNETEKGRELKGKERKSIRKARRHARGGKGKEIHLKKRRVTGKKVAEGEKKGGGFLKRGKVSNEEVSLWIKGRKSGGPGY